MLFPNADVVVSPFLLALLGLIVGTLGGFFGVGGGFLITGGLLVFGVPPLYAVGTGLTLVMGSSIISMLKHRGMGHVDFRLGLLMVCGTIPAEVLAERLNHSLDTAGIAGPVIRYVFIVFLTSLGSFLVYDFFKTRRHGATGDQVSTASLARWVQSLRIPPHSIRLPGLGSISTYVALPVSGIDRISVFIPFLVGAGIGFLAGLLGAGGGFILMPLLVYFIGVPTTVAIGTDLFQIIITGSAGTFIYALGNHVDPLMALIMLTAASAGTQLGSSATRLVDASRIRILFGITVLNGSVAIALKELAERSDQLDHLNVVASATLLGVSGAIAILIGVLLVRAKLGGGRAGQRRGVSRSGSRRV